MFNEITLAEINEAISNIDSNKSYTRHNHWKYLQSENHPAKLCLLEILNSFSKNVLTDSISNDNDFFLTQLNVIPKKGKKDLSERKSWRPISIGTSENWLFEKVLQRRLLLFLQTKDCQFGYKRNHSTSHAIELVRTIERDHDAHACLLDASSAFDKLSWTRIKDQLIKRGVPYTLIKIVITQLSLTKISVCNTLPIFPRKGVKQGGILSGLLFAACYDDLADALERTGVGILMKTSGDHILLCVIIYADDVLLLSSSPFGLRVLIEKTFLFANRYHDITFNPIKSSILRLGKHNRPAVSVCGIPVSEKYEYLGVEIGRKADPQGVATAKMYRNTNILLTQNRQLKKCCISVKNVCIYSYGNIYCLENMLSVSSRLRQSHRYMTKLVHTNWTDYADLEGPNIRSRQLYTVFQLDSLEVFHRRRRNVFLIKAASHENAIIRGVIGNLERITV